MNKQYISIIIFTIIAAISFNCKSNTNNSKKPNKDLIILLETKNQENIRRTLNSPNQHKLMKINHPVGIGAITITTLIALHQKEAPILLSKSLVQNIVDHKNLFIEFATSTINKLYSKYSKFIRFKSYYNIEDFHKNCRYIYKKFPQINNEIKNKIKSKDKKHVYNILNQITYDSRFNKNYAPKNLDHFRNSKNRAMYFEMMIYALSFTAPLTSKDWIIKKVTDEFYLFIPKNYLKDFSNLESLKFDPNIQDSISNEEIELGIKVNHLKDINSIENESKKSSTKKLKPFHKVLEKLFLTNEDLEKNNQQTNNIWSIYIAGHGLPESPIVNAQEQLKNMQNSYIKLLKSKKFQKCYESEKQDTSLKYKHINNCSNHFKFKQLKSALKRIKLKNRNLQKRITNLGDSEKGIIVSLSINDFRETIKFFNTSINTNFLYYTSCYAGGKHLIEPYTEDNKPITLNYTVASGTLAENMSMQEMPQISIPPYHQTSKGPNKIIIQGIGFKDIDFKNQKLKLKTTLKFDKFFNALKEGKHFDTKNLPKIIYYLHPYTDKNRKLKSEFICNLPSLRFAGKDQFEIIPNDNSFFVIDGNCIQSKNQEKSISLNAKPILLYSDDINKKIKISKKPRGFFTAFVSMVPRIMTHTIKKISSPELDLIDVINSFLVFPELSTTKVFWIKNLKCKYNNTYRYFKRYKQKYVKFKDVVILRNVISTNYSRSNNQNRTNKIFKTTAFLKPKNSNILFKMSWDGPYLDDYNFKIKKYNSEKFKTKIIALDPQIAPLF